MISFILFILVALILFGLMFWHRKIKNNNVFEIESIIARNILIEDYFSIENLKDVYLKKIKNKTGQGIDGVAPDSFETELDVYLENIHNKAVSSKYRFTPYLQLLKSKGRGKEPRIIAKPTIRDKLTLCVMKDIIHDACPDSVSRILPNVYIRNIREYISTINVNEYSYIKIDISSFYDSINRERLLSYLRQHINSERFITLVKRAIINKIVPINYKKKSSSTFVSSKGVPQGLAISNALASLYMEEFDKKISSLDCFYYRYVDDILVITRSNNCEKIKKILIEQIKQLDLTVNENKSIENKLSHEFSYLGYLIKYPVISVRESTVERFIESIIGLFTEFKYNADKLIRRKEWITEESVKSIFILRLNEKITGALSDSKRYGWVFYFLEINDLKLLHKIDKIINDLFRRLDKFENKAPDGVKKLVKTYYEAKFNTTGGYIHNYDLYMSVQDKVRYLVDFGLISDEEDENRTYTEDDIDRMFELTKQKHLMKLEEDLGNMS